MASKQFLGSAIEILLWPPPTHSQAAEAEQKRLQSQLSEALGRVSLAGGLSLPTFYSSNAPCFCHQILDSTVVSIPACHAGDPGSIPGRGDLFFLVPTSIF